MREAHAQALVAEAAAGREHGLAGLYDLYGLRAYGLALRVLRDETLAEDAVQDAFLTVWRSAAGYRPERGAPSTWILMIVHRRAVDIVRREQRLCADLSEEYEVADDATDETVFARVRRALAQLAPAQRRLIELAYYGGLTQAEISVELDMPLGTIKSRTFTALSRLRSLLEDGADRVSGPVEKHSLVRSADPESVTDVLRAPALDVAEQEDGRWPSGACGRRLDPRRDRRPAASAPAARPSRARTRPAARPTRVRVGDDPLSSGSGSNPALCLTPGQLREEHVDSEDPGLGRGRTARVRRELHLAGARPGCGVARSSRSRARACRAPIRGGARLPPGARGGRGPERDRRRPTRSSTSRTSSRSRAAAGSRPLSVIPEREARRRPARSPPTSASSSRPPPAA